MFRCGEGSVLEGLKAAIWMFCLKACKGGSGFLSVRKVTLGTGSRRLKAWCGHGVSLCRRQHFGGLTAAIWRLEGCKLELVSCRKPTFWRFDGCNLELGFWLFRKQG